MILEVLRSSTEESHKRLEESELLKSLHDGSISTDKYLKILSKFYSFFSPLEKAIQETEIEKHVPDFNDRRKASWLIKDLDALGRTSLYPFCEKLPEVKNTHHAFGVLYVMEGSTLGGKIISESINKYLGFGQTSGAAFFNGYGKDTGVMWKAFRQSLLDYSEKHGGHDEILFAANSTFESLYNWINDN